MPDLTPPERERLIGILARLASDFDGERAAAGLLATRLLKQKNLRWDDLIPPALAAVPEPEPDGDDWSATWRIDHALARTHLSRLTPWEQSFVTSLDGFYNASKKQRIIIGQIAACLRAGGWR